MKVKESSTIIRDGNRYKHKRSWAILDDDGYVIKRFEKKSGAIEFLKGMQKEVENR